MSERLDNLPSLNFPTNYNSILERVNQVDPVRYGQTRNFVDGSVTYLSPYISRGVISVKQIRELILSRAFDPRGIGKFLQELTWREYFQRVWQAKEDEIFKDLHQPQTNVSHYQAIEGITRAETGINSIDQSIKAFYQTGYLHNHLRMYIASIACNIGKAHWLTPSRWMYAHLLDGDLASNTCSWQWVAGTFSTKKYYCNQENINRFTRSTQVGTYLDRPTDLLPDLAVPPQLKLISPFDLTTKLPITQPPQLDCKKPALIYNSYNLDPTWRSGEDVNRVLLLEPSHFRKFPVGEKVVNFVIALSKNIPGIQIMTGEIADLEALCKTSCNEKMIFISKEHPAFKYYPGIKDDRDWLYPQITGFYQSFSSFWKACSKTEKNEGHLIRWPS